MLDRALALDLELRTASRLARVAGDAIRRVAAQGFEEFQKSGGSPVTAADLESDRVIREGLLADFPEDGLLTEESDQHILGTSGRTWIIDPLDGTNGFVAGTDDYAVHIALVEGTEPVLGVVYEPASHRLYYALKDVGAFMSVGGGGTVRQLRVSKRTERPRMPLVTSTRMDEGERVRALAELGLADGGRARSVGYKIGMLVRADVDVYFSAHPVNYWDSCAPLVVCEAAGGRMTALDGSPLSYALDGSTEHGPFIATNGHAHDELAAELLAVVGPR